MSDIIMKKETFAELLGGIDNELIERAENPSSKKNIKKSWIKWSALVASLGMVSIAFVTILNRPQYTASDIANLFGGIKGGATSSYREVFVSSAEDLDLHPILTDSSIAIYEWKKGSYQSAFSKLVNDVIVRFADKIDEEAYPSDKEILFYDSREDVQIDGIGGYQMHSWQTSFLNYTTISSENGIMSFSGIPVEIDPTQTDVEITSSLEAIKEKLFYIFDCEFADTKIVRNYNGNKENGLDGIFVYFYNKEEHLLNTMTETPISDYILLSFRSVSEEPLLTKVSASYYHNRMEMKKAFSVRGKMKMISLEEAEELLYKGYTFGHHVCPMCMREQTAVDFEGYDFVSMTYIFENNNPWFYNEQSNAMGIPFYVFYKRIGTAKNGNEIYAETFVPAIEVKGYEEYFQLQEQLHDSQNNNEY